MLIYIGWDNGVTGSIGVIRQDDIGHLEALYFHTPIKKELNYTKKKQFLNRVDARATVKLLREKILVPGATVFVALERPFTDPKKFQATMSAARCLEASLNIVELLGLSFRYIDSKEWQKALLPIGLKGDELKIASLDIGRRCFPQIDFDSFKDADGILIAEHLRRLNTNGQKKTVPEKREANTVMSGKGL